MTEAIAKLVHDMLIGYGVAGLALLALGAAVCWHCARRGTGR